VISTSNLTGAEYYSFGLEAIAYGQQFSPAPPRTFGVTAGMHFLESRQISVGPPARHAAPVVDSPTELNGNDINRMKVTEANSGTAFGLGSDHRIRECTRTDHPGAFVECLADRLKGGFSRGISRAACSRSRQSCGPGIAPQSARSRSAYASHHHP